MELSLGTAQWGMDYGITNPIGKVMPAEIGRILHLANSRGIRLLDTAPAYGSAEKLLRSYVCLQPKMRIITKTVFFDKARIDESDLQRFRDSFFASLFCLNQERVHGLLLHHGEDLLAEGGNQLHEQLVHWKKEGRVAKIGISAYDPDTVRKIIERFALDMIQVPLNVFDQRILKGDFLSQCRSQNIEVHVRSVFLQGLLLSRAQDLPVFFDPARAAWELWEKELRRFSLSRLEGALSFIKAQPVDVVVIGVCSEKELKETFDAWDKATPLGFESFGRVVADLPRQFVDPRQWPSTSLRKESRTSCKS
jgi:aryl-alcohol dehydrogenase-like predicted oxidoreductase